jgi:hypothetical protein
MRMMYDDDTGKRVHLDIRNEDRPPERGKAPRPPSKQVRELILDLVRRYKWGPDRIHAHIRHRHGRNDVSLKVIRLVVNQDKAKQRR